MKICYLSGGRIPSRDANSLQIVKMCDAFARAGHEVMLIARVGDSRPSETFARYGVEPSFTINAFPQKGIRGTHVARLMIDLLRVVRRNPPALFYSRDLISLASVAHLGRPLLFEAHNIPRLNSWRHRLLGWLVKRSNFVRLVCITDTLRQKHLDAYPALDADRVVVAASGAAALPDVIPLAHWPGRQGHFQVGFVGRPYRGKGIETVIAAAAALPDMDFHVVGAEAREVGWMAVDPAPNLHFHGYRPQPELGAYYAKFDAVTAPYGLQVGNASGIESAQVLSSLKVAEYMASGVPLVASDLPGVREVACDEISALLVPPGDVSALTAALSRLRADPALGQKLAERARADVLAFQSWDVRSGTVLAGLS